MVIGVVTTATNMPRGRATKTPLTVMLRLRVARDHTTPKLKPALRLRPALRPALSLAPHVKETQALVARVANMELRQPRPR